MIKKRKAPACGHTTGAIAEIIREQYSTLTKEEQEQADKDFFKDCIGGALITLGMILIVVLMLLVG